MSHRVEFAAGAAVIYHTLPTAAQDALRDRAVDLAERPWDDAAVRPPGDDPRFRTTLFSDGAGVLDFFVDDDAEVVRLFDMVWFG